MHLSLELDLLLSLLVRILAHHLFKLLCIVLLLLLTLVQVHSLDTLMFVEELVDFGLVAVEDVDSLSIELRLNRLQLLIVVITHVNELALH